jgi:hypothetical protein
MKFVYTLHPGGPVLKAQIRRRRRRRRAVPELCAPVTHWRGAVSQ